MAVEDEPYNLIIFKSDKSTPLLSCFLKFLTGYKADCITTCIRQKFSSLNIVILNVAQCNHFPLSGQPVAQNNITIGSFLLLVSSLYPNLKEL